MLLHGGSPWREKMFLDSDYYLEGYLLEIVGRVGNITKRYEAMERRPGSAALGRRRAPQRGGMRRWRGPVVAAASTRRCGAACGAQGRGEQ